MNRNRALLLSSMILIAIASYGVGRYRSGKEIKRLFVPTFHVDAPVVKSTNYSSHSAVSIPGGNGDVIVADTTTMSVSRLDSKGIEIWKVKLDDQIIRHRPPYLLVDVNRAYVSHLGGVTALDVRTGGIVWDFGGPSYRLLLSDDLLLATDCQSRSAADEGHNCVVAVHVANGTEAFRVKLPRKDAAPEPIEESAGFLKILIPRTIGKPPHTMLLTRNGTIFFQHELHIIAIQQYATGYIALTDTGLVRISGKGDIAWMTSFAADESFEVDGGLIPLVGGGLVAFKYGRICDSGVNVVRFDPTTGKIAWTTKCAPLGVQHLQYRHEVCVEYSGGRLRVNSRGDGEFVECLHVGDGQSFFRSVKLNWVPD